MNIYRRAFGTFALALTLGLASSAMAGEGKRAPASIDRHPTGTAALGQPSLRSTVPMGPAWAVGMDAFRKDPVAYEAAGVGRVRALPAGVPSAWATSRALPELPSAARPGDVAREHYGLGGPYLDPGAAMVHR